ncbi:helix-turn-helix domain-containing protein [Streptomyces sp. NPDC047971]|uniref:helix-turn-helix domain-containing protein n=1 Tax=Streptomyces sp. NPDC047971 TaxID=3154499 RepID=UPI00340B1081
MMETTGEPTRFGVLLQQYRKRAGFTQTELSGFSTVSVRAIRNLELGRARNPRRETVRLLAETLRLGGERRAALLIAAGHEADDAAFDHLPALPAGAARPPHGRDTERDRVLRHLRDEPGRRAILTGLAGVGKTRLARTVAHTLSTDDAMPTLWMELARPAREGRDGRPDESRPPLAVMEGLLTAQVGEAVRLVGDRAALLVLDGNDDGQVAYGTVEALLDCCPRLRVLETARTPRGCHADFRVPLHPLPLSPPTTVCDPSAAATGPAMAVLLDRIAELQPDLRVGPGNIAELMEICSRLDGLPRALESAAPWFLLCSPAELVELARTEPHALAAPPAAGGTAGSWLDEALDHALASLSPAHRAGLARAADWDTPWTMEQFATRTGAGRAEAAAAVHALLDCGLVRRMPSPHAIAFTVLHVVRAWLRARPEHAGTAVPAPRTEASGPAHDRARDHGQGHDHDHDHRQGHDRARDRAHDHPYDRVQERAGADARRYARPLRHDAA